MSMSFVAGFSPAKAWEGTRYEVSVLMARARGELLRRPQARGNWVHSFALHDADGGGSLQRDAFVAFLESLKLRLSHREVLVIMQSLAGEEGSTVSLGSFSDAIENANGAEWDGGVACPQVLPFDDAWARRALASCRPEDIDGLAGYEGRSAEEVFAEWSALSPNDACGLRAWLPKDLDDNVDWLAAEEWRVSCL